MSPRLLRPRASGGFDPRSITGLALWLDASDTATLFDANTGGSAVAADGGVGRWEDKSGNGRHATQDTANNRPLRRASAQNARGGVEFDGTNDSLTTASFQHTVPKTLFVAHRLLSATQGSFAIIAEHGRNNGCAVFNHFAFNRYAFQYATDTSIDTGVSFNVTDSRLLEFVATGDATRAVSFLINGGSLTTTTSVQTPASPAVFALSRQSTSQSSFVSQTVFEVCYYNRALSSDERQAVRSYLRSKWSLY
jgi:hypothetical protein